MKKRIVLFAIKIKKLTLKLNRVYARSNLSKERMVNAYLERKYVETMLFCFKNNVFELSPMFFVMKINTTVLKRTAASVRTILRLLMKNAKQNVNNPSSIVQSFLNVFAHPISSKMMENASNVRKIANGTLKPKNVNVHHLFTKKQMEIVFSVQEIPNSTKNNKNVFVYLDIFKGDQSVEDK